MHASENNWLHDHAGDAIGYRYRLIHRRIGTKRRWVVEVKTPEKILSFQFQNFDNAARCVHLRTGVAPTRPH